MNETNEMRRVKRIFDKFSDTREDWELEKVLHDENLFLVDLEEDLDDIKDELREIHATIVVLFIMMTNETDKV
jgi:hypothetical protein